eukprot:jgi/Ulvmu1/4872/UM020_0158.1
MSPRACHTSRAANIQHFHVVGSLDESPSRAGRPLSRDARAFGSMDLHDTFSEHSLPLPACGDVDDEDSCDISCRNAPSRPEPSLTSLSNLRPEPARSHTACIGNLSGGGLSPERGARRTLERIFSMSSHPSQSPPVLDIPDASNTSQDRLAHTGPGTSLYPRSDCCRTQTTQSEQTPERPQQFHSLPHAARRSYRDRHSCPQIGGPVQPSFSSLSLMPPPRASSSLHQFHSGPDFLHPRTPGAFSDSPAQVPPQVSYARSRLYSHASSRSVAPDRGSDADISSTLDSSPRRCLPAEVPAHMPFPVRADSPSLIELSPEVSASIGSTTSISSMSDDDVSEASKADTRSSSGPSTSTMAVLRSADGDHDHDLPTATATAASSPSPSPLPQGNGWAETRSCSDNSLTAPCCSPSCRSEDIAPAELYRATPPCPCPLDAGNDRQGAAALPALPSEVQDPSGHESGVCQMATCTRLAVGTASLLPDLSIVSTVLLAASGVMWLAYSSAMVHTLIREQSRVLPRNTAFSGLLLVRFIVKKAGLIMVVVIKQSCLNCSPTDCISALYPPFLHAPCT